MNIGDLVTRHDWKEGEVLGIIIEKDRSMATVQWTKTPRGLTFARKTSMVALKLISGVDK
tara:strand:- start:315 stop:494 length:180 start_codon:yes stop_codon:yes gene_type:complete